MSEPKFVEANGLKFGYLEWGQGPLVLMFHGFPDDAETWNHAGPRIAALGYRVVAPYMRGYPPTALPPRDTSSTDLGRDVSGLIPALGASKAIIIGHDWGAEAVAAAVGMAPERVEKLVMVAIPHRTQLPVRWSTFMGGRHFIGLRLPGALGRFMANDLAMVDAYCKRWSPTWKPTVDDLKAVKKTLSQPGAANAALGYYRGVELVTPKYLRAKVTVPTLAVCGAQDPAVTPTDFERARRQFAGRYEVAPIPGGHFCHRESPDAFVEAVTKFLRS